MHHESIAQSSFRHGILREFIPVLVIAMLLTGLLQASPAWSEENEEVPAQDPAEVTPEWTLDQLLNYRSDRLPEEPQMRVSELSFGQSFAMRSQRGRVDELIQKQFGIPERRGELSDLDLLQGVVDGRLLRDDDVGGWQAVGVVFGDILAEQFDLEWVSVEDELGTSKALQWGDSRNFVFPVTMFSRRKQFGQDIDVRQMYDKIAAEVDAFKAADDQRNRLQMPGRQPRL